VLDGEPEHGGRDEQEKEQGKEVGGEEAEEIAAVASEQPADLQEDERPD
jgi:hypothetical protein